MDKYTDLSILYLSILYIEKEKDSFREIVGDSYNIINQGLLRKEEDTFFQYSLISKMHYQSCKTSKKINREQPTIGIEPMTIALQMRCSNL